MLVLIDRGFRIEAFPVFVGTRLAYWPCVVALQSCQFCKALVVRRVPTSSTLFVDLPLSFFSCTHCNWSWVAFFAVSAQSEIRHTVCVVGLTNALVLAEQGEEGQVVEVEVEVEVVQKT